MKILAIESSCDETAVAIVEDGTKIISNVIASSHEMHEKYGGIVPEVAARKQLEFIIPTLDETLTQARMKLSDIDAIAVTVGPGLIGSLLVGVETAKTIAATTGKSIIPVNHVLAHMYANFIGGQTIEFPAISLVVSGGHTELYLMESLKKLTWLGGTLDDAAGEAFDKTARLLGFGNSGGLAIQNVARRNENVEKLPRPLLYDKTLNFSFSGLKTAIVREWTKQDHHDDTYIAGLAFEVQESITDVLVKKTIHAAERHGARSILLSGGVAANLRLREKIQSKIYDLRSTISLFIPPVALCTDNAAYIASYAFFKGKQIPWNAITAVPDLSVEVH